jgi:hypothetical protein
MCAMVSREAIDLSHIFDRVVVVNLARRQDRLEKFQRAFSNWPFKKPRRFEAIDGQTVGVPPGWEKGAGAWGCMLSHRQILDQAIADGVQSLLVLEDDACPAEDFSARAAKFFRNLPGNWDGLMLGAEHLMKPIPVHPGIVRCVVSNRTHAYAVRGRLMSILSRFWEITTNDHCDIVLAALMRMFTFYAPDPLLIGQDGGHSDVTDRDEARRFLEVEKISRIQVHVADNLQQKKPAPVGAGLNARS